MLPRSAYNITAFEYIPLSMVNMIFSVFMWLYIPLQYLDTFGIAITEVSSSYTSVLVNLLFYAIIV